MMEQIKPPAQLDNEASNLPQEWRRWKEDFTLYVDLTMTGKPEDTKLQMLRYLIGYRGREVYKTVKPSSETLVTALAALDAHYDPPENETVLRYKFFTRNQEQGESFDSFLTELKLLAEQCHFGDLQASLIRDRIICGIRSSDMRERLLRESSLTFDRCVAACRASELSKVNAGVMDSRAEQEVHAFSQKKKEQIKRQSKGNNAISIIKCCKFCGRQHEKLKEKCPAYGKECKYCGKKNHFEKQCQTKFEDWDQF